MYANSLACKITIPTRLTTNSKTLIDVFDTNTDENSIAGNLTSPIPNHLAQFLIYTNKSHRTTTISKQVCFKRNLKVLSHDAFKGYLCYKTITPQSVLSEAQVKNFFIL